jgi:hypothetical protein
VAGDEDVPNPLAFVIEPECEAHEDRSWRSPGRQTDEVGMFLNHLGDDDLWAVGCGWVRPKEKIQRFARMRRRRLSSSLEWRCMEFVQFRLSSACFRKPRAVLW